MKSDDGGKRGPKKLSGSLVILKIFVMLLKQTEPRKVYTPEKKKWFEGRGHIQLVTIVHQNVGIMCCLSFKNFRFPSTSFIKFK